MSIREHCLWSSINLTSIGIALLTVWISKTILSFPSHKAECNYIKWPLSPFSSYLYVVAPVWWRNHIEVKLIARPKNPLKVITIQKSGILRSGLSSNFDIVRFHKNYKVRKYQKSCVRERKTGCGRLFARWHLSK